MITVYRYLLASFFMISLGWLWACEKGSEDNGDTSFDSGVSDSGTEDIFIPEGLVSPEDLIYLGAFTLPPGSVRPDTFEYGGNAMTYFPDGDPDGPNDGTPGSLFIMGHDRLPYDELPDGNKVAEVTIPEPVISDNIEALPRAEFIQGFYEVVGSMFDGLDELPRVGMQYLAHPLGGQKIHIAWGQHFQEGKASSHGLFELTLSQPNPKGAWYLAGTTLYSVNGYMFEIPGDWAQTYLHSRQLATGRYRDGGWSGKGPALYAYTPWNEGSGSLPATGETIANVTPLLLYESSEQNEDIRQGAIDEYQHADEWEGGAWLTTSAGKTAVIFAGTKGIGQKFWYGFIHPAGPEYPCVEKEMVGQFTVCWNSNGTECGDEDLKGCDEAMSLRGWWSSEFAARIIFYDPMDLARVSSDDMTPDEPQPYAHLDLDRYFFNNPGKVEPMMIGTGRQRRYRLGDVAYDRQRDRLYILELFADNASPLVHVFEIN